MENVRADSSSRTLGELPRELSSFIGREHEITEVKRSLGDTRLLTLTGPGGAGKTRLALAVAQDLVEGFEDGVWWVGLASLSDSNLVPEAVAQALGVREVPDRSLTEALVEHLKPRKVLLVLDNCEHLVEGCALLVDTLLRACPELTILATSREPLRIAGEATWMVPSLSLPDLQHLPPVEELGRYEAVRLFIERAKAVNAGFALTESNASAVARLCQKLDGIPLAIELAAARVRVLTAEQISEKLEDPLGLLTRGDRTATARHQTLRATLEWSYELLSEPERILFGRLSVFAGGWTLQAVETVGAGEDIEEGEVLDLLSRLVNKSMVVVEAAEDGALRYGMLEPVRQYGQEVLAASGDSDAVRRRHASYYFELAKEVEPWLRGARQQVWLERLEREYSNLRAALEWALESGETELGLWFGGALGEFWYLSGHLSEGRRWLEAALASSPDAPPTPARAKALARAGWIAWEQGDYGRSVDLSQESLSLSRALKDEAGAVAALSNLAWAALLANDLGLATAQGEEAAALGRALGDSGGVSRALLIVGLAEVARGDHEVAKALHEESMELAREAQDGLAMALSLGMGALASLGMGDLQRARALCEEGLKLSVQPRVMNVTAFHLHAAAALASSQGRAARSARLWGAAQSVRETIGATLSPVELQVYGPYIEAARTKLGEPAWEEAWAEGKAITVEEVVEYALAQGEELRGRTPPHRSPNLQEPSTGGRTEEVLTRWEQEVAAVRSAMDEAAFDAGVAKGRAMPREQAAEYAPGQPTPHSELDTQSPSAGGAAVVLRVFALGPARVEKGGHPLTSSQDWIQKPRELLFYLLSHPPRTKEQIGLSLWPEASTSQLRSSFHDTVYRLRQALGAKEWITFQKGRYSFNSSLPYYFDVEAFEESLSEARKVQGEAPERAIGHLQEATKLYGGDFLEDFAESEWAVERQEELRRAYQEALLLLGGLLYAEERHAEAAEAYRKAIAHDKYLEEAHRGLMGSQAALGERGRAIKHYEELVEMLYEHLGTAPALETSALYERLRSGEEV